MRAMMPWTGMGNLKQELERFFGPLGELKLDEFPAMGEPGAQARVTCVRPGSRPRKLPDTPPSTTRSCPLT